MTLEVLHFSIKLLFLLNELTQVIPFKVFEYRGDLDTLVPNQLPEVLLDFFEEGSHFVYRVGQEVVVVSYYGGRFVASMHARHIQFQFLHPFQVLFVQGVELLENLLQTNDLVTEPLLTCHL